MNAVLQMAFAVPLVGAIITGGGWVSDLRQDRRWPQMRVIELVAFVLLMTPAVAAVAQVPAAWRLFTMGVAAHVAAGLLLGWLYCCQHDWRRRLPPVIYIASMCAVALAFLWITVVWFGVVSSAMFLSGARF